MDKKELDDLRAYLSGQYVGVFDEGQIEAHIRDRIGSEIAGSCVRLISQRVGKGDRILDIGSGFGSFVLSARKAGFEAFGAEIAEYEVAFARKRLHREMPGLDPDKVFVRADARGLPFDDNGFDAVTLWNVIEHVPDLDRLLSECVRILKPGGYVYIICPNYAAARKEAHYGVFWPPLLPRRLAGAYLRLMKKDPHFFETSIFYRTNWEVLSALKRLEMNVFDVRRDKLKDLDLIGGKWSKLFVGLMNNDYLVKVVHLLLHLSFINPFKESVTLCSRKGGRAQ